MNLHLVVNLLSISVAYQYQAMEPSADVASAPIKVYFCGSIRAGRADADLYAKIIERLKNKHGCKVLTAFVGDPNLTQMGSEVEGGTDFTIHDRDMRWLEEADGKLLVVVLL